MKALFLFALLTLLTFTKANADVLPAQHADKICRAKAVKAARFISETKAKLVVTYKASDIAEISTPITYDFTTVDAVSAGIDESLYTVHAYAYPDGTCTIGTISNNIAGND